MTFIIRLVIYISHQCELLMKTLQILITCFALKELHQTTLKKFSTFEQLVVQIWAN